MPSVEVGELDVAYEVFGPQDAPRVLVIGGTGQTMGMSFNASHALNTSFRTLHYDQRDLGLTHGPVRETTPARPLSSSASNCTRVVFVKPLPSRVIVCPVFAEATAAFAGVPCVAVAVRLVNSMKAGAASAGPGISK